MRVIAALVAAALFQTPSTPPSTPAAVVAEVATLAAAPDNNGRFEALTALLRGAGLSFAVEPFTIDRPAGGDPRTDGRNVVVSLGQGERTVVIGAHYDAAWLPDGSMSRGAVDNAGSTVALIHAARALGQERLGARILFVWFDMEESGLLGSQRYLTAHSADQPAMMVNFDVNAYGNTIIFSPPPATGATPLRTAIEQTCTALVIDCIRFPQLPMSDDRSFTRAGVPAASFATLTALEAHHLYLSFSAPRGSAVAPTTPPRIMETIHTANDTIDKVDGASVERSARFAAALVKRLAN